MVADRIRAAIIAGEHRPGARLIEQVLADELGFSRGPVREALLQLQQEGLVIFSPRRGCVVTGLSPAQAAEFYVLRGHLEALAVRLAASHFTRADSERLQALTEQMAALGSQDWQGAIDIDLAFHSCVVDASHSEPLIQMYHSLDARLAACFMAVKQHLTLHPGQMASRHRKLVEVLEQGDFHRAEFLMYDHWADTAALFRAVARNGSEV